MDLLTPSSPGGHPTLSLTTNSSWLPWGRVAMPLISALMPVPQVLDSLWKPIDICGSKGRGTWAQAPLTCVISVCCRTHHEEPLPLAIFIVRVDLHFRRVCSLVVLWIIEFYRHILQLYLYVRLSITTGVNFRLVLGSGPDHFLILGRLQTLVDPTSFGKVKKNQ